MFQELDAVLIFASAPLGPVEWLAVCPWRSRASTGESGCNSHRWHSASGRLRALLRERLIFGDVAPCRAEYGAF